ncbi:MAG: 2Fe-2S iron-sulfur cluster-binding protein [Ghiorsea sp.]
MWNPFKPKISGPTVHFLPMGEDVTVVAGTSVLEAALLHKIPLNHSCDGNLACSTCHIYVQKSEGNIGVPSPDEMDMLDSVTNVKPQSRLACQYKVFHDTTVEVPGGLVS